VPAARDDGVRVVFAADEAREGDVVRVRVRVRVRGGVVCDGLFGGCCEGVELPACEVWGWGVSGLSGRGRERDVHVPRSCRNLHVSPKPQYPVSVRYGEQSGKKTRKREKQTFVILTDIRLIVYNGNRPDRIRTSLGPYSQCLWDIFALLQMRAVGSLATIEAVLGAIFVTVLSSSRIIPFLLCTLSEQLHGLIASYNLESGVDV